MKRANKPPENCRRIALDDQVVFLASLLEIEPHPCGGYRYTVSGEFLKEEVSAEGKPEDKPFEPSLEYRMVNARTDTPEARVILQDLYRALQEERKSEEALFASQKRRIGFV